MNEALAITVGASARSARSRLGLTQADVAERLGIAMEVYSRMERGKVLPSVTTLRRLCQVLRTDADTLLGLELEALDEGAVATPPGEDPPRLRRLVRALRALDAAELKAVSRVVHGALGLLRRRSIAPASRGLGRPPLPGAHPEEGEPHGSAEGDEDRSAEGAGRERGHDVNDRQDGRGVLPAD